MEHSKKRSRWLAGLLAVTLTCLWPCVFMFAQNAGEAKASDMLPFFLLFLATALAGLAISGAIFRDMCRAAFFTCLGMLVVINFSMAADAIESALPWFYSRYFLLLCGALLLALLILLVKKKPDLLAGCVIVALTFGALTVMSVIQAVPKLLTTASYHRAEAPAESPAIVLSGEKRNVYYLLFDEYGGDENLETYFDFDNSEFYGALEERGFSVSHTTYNTESCWTDTLIPNLLNLDYVASDSMPEKVRREYLSDPELTRIFTSNGYSVNLINHRAYLRNQRATELTQGQTEDNISEYLFDNSIYCKIPYISDKLSLWMFEDYRDHYQGPLDNALDAMVHCCQAAADGPTLTVSYIQCPHAPFVYNADGTVRDLTEGTGWYWKDETLYPGQLQYLNGVILEAIDNIRENDPEAVILLLSDHGARVPLHLVEQFGGPRFDAEKETPVMQSSLCCVYVPGQTVDIEGDTGINATRKALNAAFGTDLAMVEPAEGYVLDEMYNAGPHPDPAEESAPETSEPAEESPAPSASPSPSEETARPEKGEKGEKPEKSRSEKADPANSG